MDLAGLEKLRCAPDKTAEHDMARTPDFPASADRLRPTKPSVARAGPAGAADVEPSQREYSSTISASLMSAPNSSRSGAFLKTPSSLDASTATQAGESLPFGELHGIGHAQLLLRLLAHRDGIARLHEVRRDVDHLAVDGDRLVRDQLARFGARRAEAHPVDDVVEARLEQQQQVRAGVALAALGLGEVAPELPLQHAVHALDLLLLAQLQAEVGRARAGSAAVLAGLAESNFALSPIGRRALFRNRSVPSRRESLALGPR